MSIITKIDFSGITSDNIVTSDNKKYIREDDEIFNSLKDEIVACENAQVQTEIATLEILEIKEDFKGITNEAIDTATERAESAAENAETAQALAETAAINALEAERNVTEFSETFAKLDEDNTFSGSNDFTGTLTFNQKNIVTSDYMSDINWDSDISTDPYIGINNLKVSGPYIYFRRGDSTTSAGSLELSARNATSASKTLKLNVDGTLTWCGKNILTADDLSNYATTSSLSSYLKSSDVKAYVSTKWLSGTSWYKKYNDGWIEQGGISAAVSGAGQITVSLNTAFKNTNYTITIATDNTDPGADQGNEATAIKSKTTTSFNVYKWNMRKVSWYACGY